MFRRAVVSTLVTGFGAMARMTQATDTSVPFIHADSVHAQGIYGNDITVAVIDTGIDLNHPGLFVNVAPGGMSWINGQPVFDGGADIWGFGHGTFMSLIIADFSGVAPTSLILSVRIFGKSGGFATPDLITAIQYVTARRAADPSIRVINLSLGTTGGVYPCSCDLDNPELASAISDAAAEGIVTFSATGNEGACGGIRAPACVSSVVRVAASYDADYSATYFEPPADCGDINPSPYWVTCFSDITEDCDWLIAAPGYDISVAEFSGYGTSAANAHCSGVAALMFDKNRCGSLDAYSAPAIMFSTARVQKWAFPYRALPPQPKHLNALAAVNAVVSGPCGIAGDLDCDNTVALFDFERFADCMAGPGGPAAGMCACADFPASPPDGDVDMHDLAAFQRAFTGYGSGACCHPDATCTDGPVNECLSEFDATYQGHGTTCAGVTCPLPDGIYSNEISPLGPFVQRGTTQGFADDMTLAAGARELEFYDLGVYGGGGGPFNVTASPYTNCPASGGTLISGAARGCFFLEPLDLPPKHRCFLTSQ